MLISTFTDGGPYYLPSHDKHQVSGIRDFLFNVRQFMEERVDYIGIFDDNHNCKGIWCRDWDVEYGEGECYDEMYVSNERYLLERDPSKYGFAYALRHLKAN